MNGGVVSDTVSVAHPPGRHEMFPADAMIVVWPGRFACADPLESMLATDPFELCHCTVGSELPPCPVERSPNGGVLSASIVERPGTGTLPPVMPPIAYTTSLTTAAAAKERAVGIDPTSAQPSGREFAAG